MRLPILSMTDWFTARNRFKKMRKEIIVAVLVGIVLGGIFTYGIRRANLAYQPIENDSTPNIQPETIDNEQPGIITSDSLSILAPEQNDVFTENTVSVTGITKPKSTVVISAEGEDFVLTSKDSGEFSQEIKLIGGLNNILVKSFSGEETLGSKTLNVVYTTKLEI